MTITNEKDDGREVINVVHNEGEDKPWELQFGDLSTFKHARAILNYPIHKFETEEKAVEVAEMLRDIVKADAVAVEGVTGELNNVQPAGFLHLLKTEEPEELETAPSLDEEPAPVETADLPRSQDANVVPVITTTTPTVEPVNTSVDAPVAPERLEVPTVEPLPPRPIQDARPVQDKGTVFN